MAMKFFAKGYLHNHNLYIPMAVLDHLNKPTAIRFSRSESRSMFVTTHSANGQERAIIDIPVDVYMDNCSGVVINVPDDMFPPYYYNGEKYDFNDGKQYDIDFHTIDDGLVFPLTLMESMPGTEPDEKYIHIM